MTIPDSIFSVCSLFEIGVYIYVKRNIRDGRLQASMQQLADMLGTTKGKIRHAIDKLVREKYLSHAIFAKGDSTVSKSESMQSVDERKKNFARLLQPFMEIYGRDMLNEFYKYWTQITPNGRKMLFEKQKAFEIPNRLSMWASKQKYYGNKQDRETARVKEQQQRLSGYAAVAAEYATKANDGKTH